MTRYRAFLALPSAARLLASALLARLPLGMSSLAIVLVVHARGGSFVLAGLASGIFTFGNAACSPAQGRLLSRLGPSRVVSATSVSHGVALAALGVAADAAAPPVTLIAIAAIAGPFVPPVSACSRGLWPRVVGDSGLLDAAYAIDAISQELLWTSGPLLVALTTALDSAVLGVWTAALLTAVGGLWFASTPAVRAAPGETLARNTRSRTLATPTMLTLLSAMACTGIGNGAIALGLVALASHLGAPAVSGALLAMLSVGSVSGGLVHGARAWSWPTWWRFRALLAAAAVLALPLCLASTIPVAFGLSAVAGLAWAALMSCQFALVNSAATPERAAEAFTWNTSALVVGIGVGTFLAGVVVGPVGSRGAFALSAAACLAACAATAAQTTFSS